MKDVASAQTERRVLDDGRLRLGIRHDLLRGVTPAMLAWWFAHLEGDIEIEGRRWPRYQIWHPVDHVAIRYVRRARDGTIGPGAQIHIREVLGGNPDFAVDLVSTIERLDDSGLVHAARVAGLAMARAECVFTAVDGGTLYRNSVTLGPPEPVARHLFNAVVRPWVFPARKAEAWFRHNVEEVGNFEFFLPALYAREAGAPQRSHASNRCS